MKKQWIKFLEEHKSNWSYGIVPSLVKRLAEGIEADDEKIVQEALEGLVAQGVILDKNKNLHFIMDINL